MLTEQEEMSNLYRGPSIDASYHVLVTVNKNLKMEKVSSVGECCLT